MARPRSEADANADEGREIKSEGSVEETIENAKDLDPGEAVRPPGVQSTTEATPSEADESSAPGPYRGDGAPKLEDPPVRAALPETPIAQTLAAGAGAHQPPDPDMFGPDGRPIVSSEEAK
jgi:hypothetical protein